jgi:hypothetical protein
MTRIGRIEQDDVVKCAILVDFGSHSNYRCIVIYK